MHHSFRASGPFALAWLATLSACGSSNGKGGNNGGPPPAPCTEIEPQVLGITGVDDPTATWSVFDMRADATGPFFLLSAVMGGVANQTMIYAVARLGGEPTTVYAQGDTTPEGAGLFTDGGGRVCALVSTVSASYTQCIDEAQLPTGLGAIASSQGFSPSRIVSSAQRDGTIFFFSFGPFAALLGVSQSGATFSSSEFFESSISFPGAAALAGGLAYSCFIGSNDALGVAGPGAIVARTHDAMTYRDCRMAGDGARLYVAAVTSTAGRFVTFQQDIAASPGVSDLGTVPLAMDAATPFDVVFFGGKPGLLQVDSGGTLALSAIASDGSLGAPRALVTGAYGWAGSAAVGPDGGLHLVVSSAGHLAYIKRCP